jgi:hypothetical protein
MNMSQRPPRRRRREPVPSRPQPFLDIINEREDAAMAQQPLSNGMTGLSRDAAVLAEVLKQLAAIQEALTHVAQKEDLKDFVRQDQFTSNQANTSGRFDDHAQRLTRLESKYEVLQDKLHQSDLADVQRFAGIQVAGAQQVSQVQATGAQQIQAVHAQTVDWQSRAMFLALGMLGSAVVYLLIYALNHPR